MRYHKTLPKNIEATSIPGINNAIPHAYRDVNQVIVLLIIIVKVILPPGYIANIILVILRNIILPKKIT